MTMVWEEDFQLDEKLSGKNYYIGLDKKIEEYPAKLGVDFLAMMGQYWYNLYKKQLGSGSRSDPRFNYIYRLSKSIRLFEFSNKDLEIAIKNEITTQEQIDQVGGNKALQSDTGSGFGSPSQKFISSVTWDSKSLSKFQKLWDGYRVPSSSNRRNIYVNFGTVLKSVELIDGNAIRSSSGVKDEGFSLPDDVLEDLKRYTDNPNKKLSNSTKDWLKKNLSKESSYTLYRGYGPEFSDFGDYKNIKIEDVLKKLKKRTGLKDLDEIKVGSTISVKRSKESSWSTNPVVSREFASGMAGKSINFLIKAAVPGSNVVIDFSKIPRDYATKHNLSFWSQEEVIVDTGTIKGVINDVWVDKKFSDWLKGQGYIYAPRTGIIKMSTESQYMSWEKEFLKEVLTEKRKVVGLTAGMAKHYTRSIPEDKVWYRCGDCNLCIPRYPGNYPKYCTNCGTDMSTQDGYPRKPNPELIDTKEPKLTEAREMSVKDSIIPGYYEEENKVGAALWKIARKASTEPSVRVVTQKQIQNVAQKHGMVWTDLKRLNTDEWEVSPTTSMGFIILNRKMAYEESFSEGKRLQKARPGGKAPRFGEKRIKAAIEYTKTMDIDAAAERAGLNSEEKSKFIEIMAHKESFSNPYTLSEKKAYFDSLNEVCYSIHCGYPMVPWSPNHRVIAPVLVEKSAVTYALYAPYLEAANRIIATKTITEDIDVEFGNVQQARGESGYVYHVTNDQNFWDILSSGKLETHKPDYGTDQNIWPDGSIEKRSYFVDSSNVRNVWQFAPEFGKPVLLRAKSSDIGARKEITGDLYTTKNISTSKLEVLTKEGWSPLSSLKESRSDKGVLSDWVEKRLAEYASSLDSITPLPRTLFEEITKCRHCRGNVKDTEKRCPNCGEKNRSYQEEDTGIDHKTGDYYTSMGPSDFSPGAISGIATGLSGTSESINEQKKSKGHLFFKDGYEWYIVGDHVYRAPLSNVFDIDTGARIGRWEFPKSQMDRLKDKKVYPFSESGPGEETPKDYQYTDKHDSKPTIKAEGKIRDYLSGKDVKSLPKPKPKENESVTKRKIDRGDKKRPLPKPDKKENPEQLDLFKTKEEAGPTQDLVIGMTGSQDEQGHESGLHSGQPQLPSATGYEEESVASVGSGVGKTNTQEQLGSDYGPDGEGALSQGMGVYNHVEKDNIDELIDGLPWTPGTHPNPYEEGVFDDMQGSSTITASVNKPDSGSASEMKEKVVRGSRSSHGRSVEQSIDEVIDQYLSRLIEKVVPANEEDVDPRQLEAGIEVEMEHTDDSEEAKQTALEHLAEDPDYYKKLDKVMPKDVPGNLQNEREAKSVLSGKPSNPDPRAKPGTSMKEPEKETPLEVPQAKAPVLSKPTLPDDTDTELPEPITKPGEEDSEEVGEEGDESPSPGAKKSPPGSKPPLSGNGKEGEKKAPPKPPSPPKSQVPGQAVPAKNGKPVQTGQKVAPSSAQNLQKVQQQQPAQVPGETPQQGTQHPIPNNQGVEAPAGSGGQNQGEQPPGQPPPGQISQNAPPAQGVGQPTTTIGAATTIDLLLGNEQMAQQAYETLVSLGIPNVHIDGTTLRVSANGAHEADIVGRIASAFGLELSGLTPMQQSSPPPSSPSQNQPA